MEDAADLKSVGAIRGGSSPLSGTILYLRRSEKMSNKKLYTVPISKERFIETIHSLGWSIRDLGKNTYIDRTEKNHKKMLK